jgi:peptide/nickel transport system substrate-binding protein
MKVIYAWALGLALLPAAARSADAPANSNATLVYFDAAANATFDPLEPQSNSSVAQAALMAAYDSLVKLTDTGEPIPGLAASWRYNADLTEFTIALRPGVIFHDGTPMNAAAIARNFERAIGLGTRAGAATIETMRQIAAVETQGEDTVRLKLTGPNGQMPYLLSGQPGMMVSPAVMTGDAFGGSLKPVGAGPYRIKNYEASARTLYERFDAYWGGTEGRPKAIEHHFVPDGRARLNAVRSGQATMALIDSRQIPEAKAAGLVVQVNQKNVIQDVYLNQDRETIGNLKVRQAFMHAIDRAAVAEALGGGVSQPTAQAFGPTSPLYDKALEAIYPFDQAKARRLLAEAGYKDGVDITWLVLNASEYRLVGEAVQAMVAEVGIRLKLEVIDLSQYQVFRLPPKRGDVMMGRWGGRADPLQTFQELTGTGGSVNPGRAAVPEIDALIGEARRLDPADPKRMDVLRRLAKVTTEQVGHIALMTRPNVYVYRTGCITGMNPYLAAGSDRFNDVKVLATCK